MASSFLDKSDFLDRPMHCLVRVLMFTNRLSGIEVSENKTEGKFYRI